MKKPLRAEGRFLQQIPRVVFVASQPQCGSIKCIEMRQRFLLEYPALFESSAIGWRRSGVNRSYFEHRGFALHVSIPYCVAEVTWCVSWLFLLPDETFTRRILFPVRSRTGQPPFGMTQSLSKRKFLAAQLDRQ